MIVMINHLLVVIVILSSVAAFTPIVNQQQKQDLAGPWSGGFDFLFSFGLPDFQFNTQPQKQKHGNTDEADKPERPPLLGLPPNTKITETGSPNEVQAGGKPEQATAPENIKVEVVPVDVDDGSENEQRKPSPLITELLSIGGKSNCSGRSPLSVPYNKWNIPTLSGVDIPQYELSVSYGDTLICPATFITSDKTRSPPTRVSWPAERNQFYTLMLVDLYIDENLDINITRSERCFQDQMGLAGGNIRNVNNVLSAGACRDLCQQEENCAAWTYRQATYPRAQYRNTCALKDKTRKAPKPFRNVVSGPRDCPDRHYLHYMKSNIAGDDLTSGDVVFKYLSPAVPSQGNPPKPLVFFVFQQVGPINSYLQEDACSPEAIFSSDRISPALIPNLVRRYNLTSAPTAGNFFLLDEFVPAVDNSIWCDYEKCTGQCMPFTGDCRCSN